MERATFQILSGRTPVSFNDTTPLARGRTVGTKTIRAQPEVNQAKDDSDIPP
jgi:hypothetical protein